MDRSSISPDLASVQYLKYRVMSRLQGEPRFTLKATRMQRVMSGLLFELGAEEYDYTHEVSVTVLDFYGGAASVNFTVKVDLNSSGRCKGVGGRQWGTTGELGR